jgi:hypothetical protein
MKNTSYIFEGGKVLKTVTDKPESKADILRSNLTIAVTAYDYSIRTRAARNPRVYHNPFALWLYLDAVGQVVNDVQNGIGIEQALRENFVGHMLNYLLRRAVKAVR